MGIESRPADAFTRNGLSIPDGALPGVFVELDLGEGVTRNDGQARAFGDQHPTVAGCTG